jgi:ADP-L-glycero-D-manno-heptose 6-epimerase
MHTKIYDDKFIIITGACGFIGSCVVRHLNDQGFYNLILVDDLRGGDKWKNLVGKRYQELISKEELFDWLIGRDSEIEAFIHLGACPSTIVSDGDYIQKNNYQYSIKLAEYALAHEHRFIYASSASTYGMSDPDFKDDHEKLELLHPLNLYGYSKHMVDLWMKEQGVLDQVVGLKYFNVYGPNEYHKKRMGSMVMHMTKSILDEGIVRLFKSSSKDYEDGEQLRDFIYVKDVVAITCSFLNNDLGGVYNVGSAKAVSWNELARVVFKALGKKEHISYFDMPEDLRGHYLSYTRADMTKYFKDFQANDLEIPKLHSLEEAITDYVQNYLIENKRW